MSTRALTVLLVFAGSTAGLVASSRGIPLPEVPATEHHQFERRAQPYSRIVAFGDDYSDNSQGSYAHGITGDPTTGAGKNLWGYGTWTDGPVAVTYMSQYLNIPLTYSYAFGSSLGGQTVGSVCNVSAVPAGQLNGYAKLLNGQVVPDLLSQIANYTSNPTTKANIATTLHVVWTGNNDVIPSLGWTGRFTICTDGLCTYTQNAFLAGYQQCIATALQTLVNAGARYIVVPDIYPRHLTPWMSQYITPKAGYIANFGSVIDRANALTAATVSSINARSGTKIQYFKANQLITNALSTSALVGIGTGYGGQFAPGYNNTCVDGCPVQGPLAISNWSLYWSQTVLKKGTDYFVWMTATVMSTTLMKALGAHLAGTASTAYSF